MVTFIPAVFWPAAAPWVSCNTPPRLEHKFPSDPVTLADTATAAVGADAGTGADADAPAAGCAASSTITLANKANNMRCRVRKVRAVIVPLSARRANCCRNTIL